MPGGGLCRVHKRESSARRQYSSEWADYSRGFLRVYRWCGDRPSDAPPTTDSACAARGLQTPATQTDHIQPHGGDARLLWAQRNHQALCASCHARKTATRDGGFGR